MMFFWFSLFGAVAGAFIYFSRAVGCRVKDQIERQEKPMRVALWRESNPLSNVKVAAPCPADWRSMYGNDRVRFCSQCRLNVYNLSAMTRPEAERLIMQTEGRLCVRFYRRADGTILTQNCPVGLRVIKERFNRIRTHILGAAISLASFFGFASTQKFAGWTTDDPEGIAYPYVREVMGVMPAPYNPFVVQRSESFIRGIATVKAYPFYHANPSGRISGEAVVKITINEVGEIESAELIKGHPLLREAAEEAARRWKFGPILSNGLPAKVESQLTFHFSN